MTKSRSTPKKKFWCIETK